MPTVGRYDSNIREEAGPRLEFKNNATAEAFGSGAQSLQNVTSAASDLGKTVFKIQREEKEKADKAGVMKGYGDYAKTLIDLEGKLSSTQGDAALGVREDLVEALSKQRGLIKESLGNDDQRNAFDALADRDLLYFEEKIQKHIHGEKEKQFDARMKYGAQAADERAVLNVTNPKALNQALADKRSIVNELIARSGHSPESEEAKMMRFNAESETHRKVIERFVDLKNPARAAQYLEHARKNNLLNEKDFGTVAGKLDVAKTDTESFGLAENLWAKAGKNYGRASTLADSIKDPKLKKSVLSNLSTLMEHENRRLREGEENTYKTTYNILDQFGNVAAIPPDIRAGMSEKEIEGFAEYAERKRKGKEQDSDIRLLTDLREMALNPTTRHQFKDEILHKHKGRLSDKDFKALEAMQDNLRNGKSTDELQHLSNQKLVINETLREAKLDPDVKGNKEKVAKFWIKLDEDLEAFQLENDRMPNRAEMKDLADRLLIKQQAEGNWLTRMFKKDPHTFEVESATPAVPAMERTKIVKALKQKGYPITEGRILQTYQDKKARDGQ